MKLYEKKFRLKENNKINIQKERNSSLIKTELPEIKKDYNNFIETSDNIQESEIKTTITSAKMRSSLKSLNSLMFGNLFIVYKNNKSMFVINISEMDIWLRIEKASFLFKIYARLCKYKNSKNISTTCQSNKKLKIRIWKQDFIHILIKKINSAIIKIILES